MVDVENYFKASYLSNKIKDLVQFWVDQESTFPILAPFAIDLLVIPASSAPVERMFSTAGIVNSLVITLREKFSSSETSTICELKLKTKIVYQ